MQFATTVDLARVIVGVEVINRGSDAGRSLIALTYDILRVIALSG